MATASAARPPMNCHEPHWMMNAFCRARNVTRCSAPGAMSRALATAADTSATV